MADIGIWGLGAIASPAATDRLPLESGVSAGGYSLRGEFVWKGGGVFKADAPIQITAASGNAVLNLIETGVRNWAMRSGALATNVFDIADLTGGASRFSINQNGHVGIGGVNASARLHVKSSSEIACFETTTARGGGNGYMSIRDPSGRKAYVGCTGGSDDFYVFNEMNTSMIFGTNASARWAISAGGSLYAATDNAYAFGGSSNRCTVVYSATGTINTSDAREKTWRGAMTEAEIAAARRIIGELGFFQWNDAIAEKGPDGARYHFGARAQAVWAIMADEDLIDPIGEGVTPSSAYAFLCYDEWEADEATGVEAGNRFGIRPDQLALFLIAAQEARIAAIEAALSEGE